MLLKAEEKKKAINLRKQGFSYSEILKQIPVAKSTLSLWLQSVGLSKKQKQRLTEKKLAAALRGAKRKKEIRLALVDEIKSKAEKEIGNLTKRELWLIGIALYWGEGSKEKDNHPGSPVKFSNSDPAMIRIFLKWLLEIAKVPREKIYPDIYIHESHRSRINKVIDYWVSNTVFSKSEFKYIYFKKNKTNTKRKNIGDSYYGLLRICVRASSTLNRTIAGWIQGINKCSQ